VSADPPASEYGSTNDSPDTLGYTAPAGSTAFWVSYVAIPIKTMLIEERRDMSSAYADVTSVHRGMRTLNGRRQMLVQDEIVGAEEEIQWRMQ
jgi:hypothetical protein